MYAVSFRIPYEILGQRAYVNGSLHSSTSLEKGRFISVVDKTWSPGYNGIKAEVIESNRTQRHSSDPAFKWRFV